MNSRQRELTHDRLADKFDAVMNPYDVRRRMQVLVEEFLGQVDLNGRVVLDGGCGTGRATSALVNRGAKVVPLDLGLRLASYVKERYPSTPVNGSLLALPFADNTFDVVLSSEVIEHTPDPSAAVTELCRVTKPGGHLVLSTPNWLWQFPVRLASTLRLRPYNGLENFLPPSSLRRTVEEAGLSVVEHRGIHLLPFQLKVLWPVLPHLDKFGSSLLPIMINQCIHATKPR